MQRESRLIVFVRDIFRKCGKIETERRVIILIVLRSPITYLFACRKVHALLDLSEGTFAERATKEIISDSFRMTKSAYFFSRHRADGVRKGLDWAPQRRHGRRSAGGGVSSRACRQLRQLVGVHCNRIWAVLSRIFLSMVNGIA